MDRRANGASSSLLKLFVLALLCLTGSFAAPSDNANGGGLALQHRVTLRVYFRAFCPACQWFVSDPLLELVRSDQFRNVVNLRLFPAAGMTDEKGDLICEGGSLECTGHRLEVCLIDKDRDDVVKYLGNVACLEGDESGRPGDWSEKLKNCLTPEERAEIDVCYKTKSDELLREMIHKENSGSVEWMPYTVVEEKVLGSASQGVGLGELQAGICAAYKGPKQFYPEACSELVGDQRQVATDDGDTAVDAPLVADAPDPPAAEEEAELELDVKEEVASPTDKVQLDVYWRAFCPGCMAFIGNPLLTLLRNEQFRNTVDFRPVPAAGTYLDSAGNFVCSMGLVECMGHKWMSCAIDLFPKVEELIEYLACLESKDNKGVTWSFVINKCFPGEHAKNMKACYDTRADDLLKQHVAQRDKVDVLWVPYVLVNGAPIGDARHGIGYKQLSDEVCKGYSGPIENRPTECQPKRLRVDEDKPQKKAEPVIKPCPPKKDKKPAAVTAAPADAAEDEDAPGIGARVESDLQNANAFAANNKNGKAVQRGDDADAVAGSLGGQSFLVPGLLIVVVGFVAYRFFSGDQTKKHA